jgi:hypothetical protein
MCSSVTRKGTDNAMANNYEDNFGFYSFRGDPHELAFFGYIKLSSVPKACVRCNQKVYLQTNKKICAMCSEALEYGAPSSLEEYE